MPKKSKKKISLYDEYLLSIIPNPFLLNCTNEVKQRHKYFHLMKGETGGAPVSNSFSLIKIELRRRKKVRVLLERGLR